MSDSGNADTEVTLVERDLKSLDPLIDPIRIVREKAAMLLGSILLSILAIAVLGQLTLCFVVLWSSSDLMAATALVERILVASEHFDAAVLLPLLAFTLGYFFGTHKH